MKHLSFIVVLLWASCTINDKDSEKNIDFIRLNNAPGAVTECTVSLVWPNEYPLKDGFKYQIYQNEKPIATTTKTFYRITELSADSIYEFKISLLNGTGKVVGISNVVKARTKFKGKSISIIDFGAKSDGKTLNTQAIQLAIDRCPHNGTVIIPKGVFITGALFVKSNMTLYIEKGAVLKGSHNKVDYPVVRSRYEGLETDQYASIINGGELCGKGIQNFSIRGEGTINGEGETLFISEKKRDVIKRGRIVSIINGEKIYLEGVSFIHSPSRAVHFIYCNGITVENITINTRFNPETGERYKITNGDGLTLGSSKNAYIFNSTISSQDDDISLKSGRDNVGRKVAKSTEHIRIFECKFLGGLGVVTGSEMSGSIRDILINNCYFENTAFVAQLKAPYPRGNVIENVRYMNIQHSDTLFGDNKWFRGGICIDQYYGDENPDFSVIHPVDENMPLIRDVWFENITLSREKGMAIYLCGRPEIYVKNINLKNIHAKGLTGFFGRYVDQLKLDNVRVEVQSGEAFNWEEVKNLTVN